MNYWISTRLSYCLVCVFVSRCDWGLHLHQKSLKLMSNQFDWLTHISCLAYTLVQKVLSSEPDSAFQQLWLPVISYKIHCLQHTSIHPQWWRNCWASGKHQTLDKKDLFCVLTLRYFSSLGDFIMLLGKKIKYRKSKWNETRGAQK